MPDLDASVADVLGKDRMNTGIAIVVPVYKILEVLNQEELMKRRKQRDDELKKKLAPTLDSADIPKFVDT